MSRLLTIACSLLLTALFIGCTSKPTYQARVRNDTDEVLSVGLIIPGDRPVPNWETPEHLARMDYARAQVSYWGINVEPGATVVIGPKELKAEDVLDPQIRIYAGRSTIDKLIAQSRGADRVDYGPLTQSQGLVVRRFRGKLEYELVPPASMNNLPPKK